jgi:hypothetical protein
MSIIIPGNDLQKRRRWVFAADFGWNFGREPIEERT